MARTFDVTLNAIPTKPNPNTTLSSMNIGASGLSAESALTETPMNISPPPKMSAMILMMANVEQ
jgi:hypothetical protein